VNLSPDIKALKRKDQKAFEAVYHETKHAVFAMVLPIVKDRSLAEDAMQETYVKMIANINSYDKKRPFMTWLLSIAKHSALDLVRNRRDIPVDQNERDDLFVSKESPVEKQMESEYYLSLLDETERRIVLLKTAGGLRHTEIAQIMEMPQGTVRYKYKEALDKMRNAATKEGHYEKTRD